MRDISSKEWFRYCIAIGAQFQWHPVRIPTWGPSRYPDSPFSVYPAICHRPSFLYHFHAMISYISLVRSARRGKNKKEKITFKPNNVRGKKSFSQWRDLFLKMRNEDIKSGAIFFLQIQKCEYSFRWFGILYSREEDTMTREKNHWGSI